MAPSGASRTQIRLDGNVDNGNDRRQPIADLRMDVPMGRSVSGEDVLDFSATRTTPRPAAANSAAGLIPKSIALIPPELGDFDDYRQAHGI